MRLWYSSHRRPAKARASLRIRAVSPEPSLFAHMKYGSRQRFFFFLFFFSVRRMLTDERRHSRYAECIDSCLHEFCVQMG